MKKFLLFIFLLIPISSFAQPNLSPGDRISISKGEACVRTDGYYEGDLEIKGFENALALTFVKSNNILYYVVIDRNNNKHFFYSYNCVSKKSKLLIGDGVFQKIASRTKDITNYEAVYLVQKNQDNYDIVYNIGSVCDGGSCDTLNENEKGYKTSINMRKRFVEITNKSSHKQTFHY